MDGRATAVVYDCSGLRIASEIPLTAPRSPAEDLTAADVTLVLGEARPTAFERPSADVVAELIVDDFPRYTICRVPDGYVARIMSVADFVIDADLRTVVCHPVPEGRDDVIPIVVSGTIVAFLLAMRGGCVLHASAVDVSGRAVAFVGVSGQGKSTMAALCCVDGAALVTDDVLPLEFESGPGGACTVYCLRSSQEVRLRDKSASLVERFGAGASVRMTADERHAVAPAASSRQRVPLAAIVLPRPDRQNDQVSARRLGEGEASLRLAQCLRIEGWQGQDHLRQQFVDIGRVVDAVPVFEVLVPWGPPFAEDLARRVLEACSLVGVQGGAA